MEPPCFQSTGKRTRRNVPKETSTVRKKPRTETTDSEGSLFEIVKSGKTALNVCVLWVMLYQM